MAFDVEKDQQYTQEDHQVSDKDTRLQQILVEEQEQGRGG